MRIALLFAHVVALATVLQAQVNVSIGISGSAAASSYSTNILLTKECNCGPYGNGSGSSEAFGLESYLRTPIAPTINVIAMVGGSKSATRSTWRVAEVLDAIDGNGMVVKSIFSHSLAFSSQSTSGMFGVGVELGSWSFIPFCLISSTRQASTVNSFNLEQPEDGTLTPQPGIVYENNGRTAVYQRLGAQDHTSTVVSAGMMFGYTVSYSLFGVSLDNSVQAYGMSGLSSVHQRYTTNLSYEVGARLFLGVRL